MKLSNLCSCVLFVFSMTGDMSENGLAVRAALPSSASILQLQYALVRRACRGYMPSLVMPLLVSLWLRHGVDGIDRGLGGWGEVTAFEALLTSSGPAHARGPWEGLIDCLQSTLEGDNYLKVLLPSHPDFHAAAAATYRDADHRLTLLTHHHFRLFRCLRDTDVERASTALVEYAIGYVRPAEASQVQLSCFGIDATTFRAAFCETASDPHLRRFLADVLSTFWTRPDESIAQHAAERHKVAPADVRDRALSPRPSFLSALLFTAAAKQKGANLVFTLLPFTCLHLILHHMRWMCSIVSCHSRRCFLPTSKQPEDWGIARKSISYQYSEQRIHSCPR